MNRTVSCRISAAATKTGRRREALWLLKLPQKFLGLLASSWQFRDVPELRPVFVCVLRWLGECVLMPMLRRRRVRRAGSEMELRNGDLMGQLESHLRQLVWEANWDTIAVSGDGGDVEGGGVTPPADTSSWPI